MSLTPAGVVCPAPQAKVPESVVQQFDPVQPAEVLPAKRLKETLGYPSDPNDWKYEVHTWESNDGDLYSTPYLETELLGVEISVRQIGRRTDTGWEEDLDWTLTLASFGEMLKRKRQQEQR